MEIAGGERIATGHVRESHEGMHERELPRVIESESWNAFAVGQARGFRERAQLPAVYEGLEDVLLDRQVAVRHRGHRVAQLRQMVDGFRNAEVPDIVGRRLGPEYEVFRTYCLMEPSRQ